MLQIYRYIIMKRMERSGRVLSVRGSPCRCAPWGSSASWLMACSLSWIYLSIDALNYEPNSFGLLGTWSTSMRIWYVAREHPPTDNWQRPDESMNTRRSWTARGFYWQDLLSSTDLNNEEAVGWARTKGVGNLSSHGIYTNVKIKSQICIQQCYRYIDISLLTGHPFFFFNCMNAQN